MSASMLIHPNDKKIQVHTIKSRKSLFATGGFGEVSIALGIVHESKHHPFSIQYLAIKTIRNAFHIKSNTNHSFCFYDDEPTSLDESIMSYNKDNNTTEGDRLDISDNINNATTNTNNNTNKNGYELTKEAFAELSVLRRLCTEENDNRHSCITPLLSVLQSDTNDPLSLSLVFPYALIDLATVIELQRNKSCNNSNHSFMNQFHLQEAMLQTIMGDILSSIEFCHSKGIIHRDIKPGNFVISAQGYIQLTDFGLAKVCNTTFSMDIIQDSMLSPSSFDSKIATITHTNNSNAQCTLHYRSPELLFSSKEYGYEVDIWGCGLILAELINLRPLFPGRTVIDQIGRIFYVLGTPNPESWSDAHKLDDYNKCCFKTQEGIGLWKAIPRIYGNTDIHDLLDRMLSLDPRKRPSASFCRSHVWLINNPNSPILRSHVVEHLIPPPLHIFKTWLDTVPLEEESHLPLVLEYHIDRALTLASARHNLAKSNIPSCREDKPSINVLHLAELLSEVNE